MAGIEDLAAAPEWALALTLAERARLPAVDPAPESLPQGRRPAAARRRLERWRGLAPFRDANGAALWQRRLAADGLDEAGLLALLSERPEDLARRAAAGPRPEWVQDLIHAYGRPENRSGQRTDAAAPGQQAAAPAVSSGTASGAHGLLDVVGPLLRAGQERLTARLASLAAAAPDLLPGPVATAALLTPHLAARLHALLTRTLVLELHIAGLEGRLDGTTPEERFASFRERLRRPAAALSLLRTYPALARQVTLRIRQWVEVSGELVERLVADRHRLRAAFCPDAALGRLVEVSAGAGDPHRGGHTVTLLRFDSGLRLVYKPKPMAVEAAFQDLLRWFAGRGLAPAPRTLAIVDGGAYGWMEHASPAPCADAAALERFYLRLGALLAILYALDAGDMHSENLIAAGEDPLLIDLEALFHPAPDDLLLAIPEAEAATQVTPPAWRSVLRVGLLPERLGARDGHPGVDLSGMGGGGPGQTTPRPLLQVTDAGTDRMRFIRQHAELPPTANRPAVAGGEVRPYQHADPIATGFAQTYRLLAAGREALLAPGGPLAAFAGAEVRVLLRATAGYGALLTESFHPDVLGDALRRDQLFDQLWSGLGDQPRLPALVAAERRDLERGDVPIFTTRPEALDLWTGDGERLPAMFAASGLDRVRQHIAGLDEADLVVQEWSLRGTLAALALSAGAFRNAPHRVAAAPAPATRRQLLTAARAVGARLAQLANRDGERAYWFGLGPTADNRWVFGPLQADLYGGLPGVALFLAHLGEAGGDPRATALARAALASLRPLLRGETPPLPLLGAYGGWGGLIYSLLHLGVLWRDPGLLADAEGCVAAMLPWIAADEYFDLLDGAAGGLAGLLALHAVRPAAATLAAARACGDHLLAGAVPQAAGLGWRVPAGPRPLTGFSHGAAGIGWALAGLAAATGEHRYRDAAQAALVFERAHFSAEERAWPDLRDEERQRGWAADEERAALAAAAAAAARAAEAARNQDPARLAAASRAAAAAGAAAAAAGAAGRGEGRLCAWCHGAIGIGFSRLGLLDLARRAGAGGDTAGSRAATARLREEVHIAVGGTVEAGFGRDHSLCHGDLGSLDFLLTAARRCRDPELRRHAGRLAAGVLASIAEEGWRFGVASGAEPPGLMVGLAGIGYGLLRLAFPARVPSVLLLELPPAGAGR